MYRSFCCLLFSVAVCITHIFQNSFQNCQSNVNISLYCINLLQSVTLAVPSYRQTSFYCASLHWASLMLRFLQIKGKIFHQQKDHDSLLWYSLHCVTLELTHSISEACGCTLVWRSSHHISMVSDFFCNSIYVSFKFHFQCYHFSFFCSTLVFNNWKSFLFQLLIFVKCGFIMGDKEATHALLSAWTE